MHEVSVPIRNILPILMMNVPVVRDHPDEFKDGTRILMLSERRKDNADLERTDKTSVKIVTHDIEQFSHELSKLLLRRKGSERIYSTVNARSMDKGMRLFKMRQLDNDYAEDPQGFYRDIWNRWVSCLHNQTSRASTLFLIDVDHDEDDEATIRAELAQSEVFIVHEYATKNGVHIITEPFNPASMTFADKINKDGMMLWAWGITPRGNEGRIIPPMPVSVS